MEDCRHISRGLEGDLLTVVRHPAPTSEPQWLLDLGVTRRGELMVNDTGYVPPIHDKDRPRLPFSWKTVVLTILALAILASPLLIIWASKGFQ
jgi:hypothetical protein